ncbi:hypothetical protein GEV27_03465 [Aeromicrobium sp. S22]|uniref:hypothetical protein n=1 Tax=Aeromicrobium sp. S22 TaxID=2662029 RepID=UPI00129D3071|nr:hypothetical protein [Aeromicrobium sp. S22]MRK00571.1 hypothetical protein [Aeromicrobium sp. S22]
MKSRAGRMALAVVMLTAVAACTSDPSTEEDPAPTVTPQPTKETEATDLSEHESGPENPIAYGLFVPQGAAQLGPLFRYRSPRLISAYRPELDAAQAQKDAEAAERIAEDEAKGTPSPTPTPTPTTRPSPDSFKLLEEPPRPDTTISLMRIDGDPDVVVRRMLAQMSAAVPDADVQLDDLSAYCTSKDRRITGCRAVVRGLTEGNRDIKVTMGVDPGRLSTRTAPPAALTHPVMQVTVEYVGDPRAGQLASDTGSLKDIPEVSADGDKSGLIWPKMDEDAPLTTKLVHGWTAPSDATLLLSSFTPEFAAVTTPRATNADRIAEQYVLSHSPDGRLTKDVTEDLNSVSTMYAVRTKNGSIARAVYILSARGNYTALFYTPREK